MTEKLNNGGGTAKSSIDRLILPFQEFVNKEASGGILLIIATVFALIWANSPWAESYDHFFHLPVSIGFGSAALSKTLVHWINDGLMVIFFFVVGLEIKREVLAGELSSVRLASLPIAAAAGGMLAPAMIYAAMNSVPPALDGWGIPMATDIAFTIGLLSLLGNRVPAALKVFLVALAIVDDMGAVLVIAVFYTAGISFLSLGIGLVILAVLFLFNILGVRNTLVYAVLGILLWLAFLKSGVHATIAGILLAMTIPARSYFSPEEFKVRARAYLDMFAGGHESGGNVLTDQRQRAAVQAIETACHYAETPLQRMEHALHPWVSLVIMPVFALANAGVAIGSGFAGALAHSVTLVVISGIFIGKCKGLPLFVVPRMVPPKCPIPLTFSRVRRNTPPSG